MDEGNYNHHKSTVVNEKCHGSTSLECEYKQIESQVDLDKSRSNEYSTRYVASRLGALYLAFMTSGMTQALLGSTLLELQIQTSAEFDRLSLLVTWSFLARMCSSAVASSLFDRLHAEMQIGLCMFIGLCSTIFIPLSRNYIVVSLMIGIQGFGNGYMTTGSGARCFELLGDRVGPYLQGLYFMYAFGGAITPPIVKPFLTTSSEINATNITAEFLSHTERVDVENTEQLLHPGTFYPNLVLAIFQTLVFVYFVVLFSNEKCDPIPKRKQHVVDSVVKQKVDKVMLVLFSCLIFCSVGMETTFASLLYAYTVKHLQWDVGTANILLTTFWVTFAISRGVGMFHARFIHPKQILTAFFTLQAVSFIVIAALSHISPYTMWICVPCVAISLSTQVASIFQYAGKHFPITGKTLGILMVCSYSSGIANPPLTGYLFKNFNMQWFIYVQLVFIGILIPIFITIRFQSRRMFKKNQKLSLNEDDKRSKEEKTSLKNEST